MHLYISVPSASALVTQHIGHSEQLATVPFAVVCGRATLASMIITAIHSKIEALDLVDLPTRPNLSILGLLLPVANIHPFGPAGVTVFI